MFEVDFGHAVLATYFISVLLYSYSLTIYIINRIKRLYWLNRQCWFHLVLTLHDFSSTTTAYSVSRPHLFNISILRPRKEHSCSVCVCDSHMPSSEALLQLHDVCIYCTLRRHVWPVKGNCSGKTITAELQLTIILWIVWSLYHNFLMSYFWICLSSTSKHKDG